MTKYLFILLLLASNLYCEQPTRKATKQELRIVQLLKKQEMTKLESKELADWLSHNLMDKEEINAILKLAWGETKQEKKQDGLPWRYAEFSPSTDNCWTGECTLECQDAKDIMTVITNMWIKEDNLANVPHMVKIWTHPDIKNKAVISFTRDAYEDYYDWAVKKNDKWYIPDNTWTERITDELHKLERIKNCKKWGINPDWDFKNMFNMPLARYTDYSPQSVTKSVIVKEWVWSQMWIGPSYREGIFSADKHGNLIHKDLFKILDLPQDARQVFSIGDYLYYQTQEEIIKKIVEE